MTIPQYIDLIHKQVQLGNATEHTFRGYLSQLIETIAPDVLATNEPKRQKCGAPDGNSPKGWRVKPVYSPM